MHSPTTESWRLTWRNGFAPLLSTRSLEALRRGLASNDPSPLQGATTSPPPLPVTQEWPCESACAVAYGSWVSEHLETVQEVEAAFAQLCPDADQRLGEPGACRWFLNWFDETPRADMRRELLAEVAREIANRLLPAGHAA